MKAFIYPFLLLSIVLSSCVRPCYVSTSTYADMQVIPHGFPWGSSFALVLDNGDNSLFAKEMTYKISRFLQESGYCVRDVDTADFVLAFNYDMNSTTKIVNVPVYVPGATQVREGCVIGYEGTTSYQETTESGTTVMMPEEVVVFHRELSLNVYYAQEYRRGHKEEVWQGFAKSDGSSGDLRDTIDYLLVAAFRYFGLNTKKDVHITLNEKDPVIQWIRQ